MTTKTSVPRLRVKSFKTGVFAPNVVHPFDFQGEEKDTPVLQVLQGAMLANLTDVVIMGFEPDGTEYIATSTTKAELGSYMYGRGQLFMLRLGD